MSAPRLRHVVIMAAGRGLRMGALTERIPKAMAPYLDTTLIGQGIARLRPVMQRIHVTVGYKGAMLAQHLVERGVDTVLNTEGHGNAWWIGHTLLSALDEPVAVLTCDNVTDLDYAALATAYDAAGAPPCLLVPVRPVPGIAGDYITHEDGVVTRMSREHPTDLYASGIQVLNPARVHALCPGADAFHDVWRALIAHRALRLSRLMPRAWHSVDTLADLQRLP